jgi:rubrerythrin
MSEFETIDDVFDFAIFKEIESHKFYTQWACQVKKPSIRKMLEQLAEDEAEHRKKIEAVRAGTAQMQAGEIASLDIADYVDPIEPHPDMNYVDLLVVAMNKEKKSFKLYWDLVQTATEPRLKELFQWLCRQEAEHKLQFELEYDLSTF